MDTNFANIPAPTEAPEVTNSLSTDGLTIDADSIFAAMTQINESGHSPNMITVSLERINKIVPGQAYIDYSDEEKEFIDSVDIGDCAVDLSSLDGNLFNLMLTFDTRESVYLKDLNDILNRYRHVLEEYATQGVTDKGVVLSVIIAPDVFKGRGMCVLNMPTMFVRCLADNGENASMLMQFYVQDVDFYSIEMTEEDEINLTADAMRLVSAGDGSLFED